MGPATALYPEGPNALGPELFAQGSGQGGDLPVGAAGGDHEEVGQGGELPGPQHDDVAGLMVGHDLHDPVRQLGWVELRVERRQIRRRLLQVGCSRCGFGYG